jgi:hypothetical protein
MKSLSQPRLCKNENLKTASLTNVWGLRDHTWKNINFIELYRELYIINYRFLTAETNLKVIYIFHCFFATSLVKLFVVTVHISVYNFLFRIVFFGKRKNNTHETFHILKMKAHFETETHFGNESSFWNPLNSNSLR